MLTTISNYLKTKHIFDGGLTSYDYIDSGIITALENVINVKFGACTLYTDDETMIKSNVTNMFALNDMKYTSLFNIDKLDDPTKEYSETKTNTGTQTNANTGTQSDSDTGTVTNVLTPSVVATTTESKNTADNGTLRAIAQVQNSSTGTDNNTRTDNLAHSRTDNLLHTRTDNLTETRTGYNNQFANAELILNFSRNVLYDIIINDVIKLIVIPIYGKEDLILWEKQKLLILF